MGRIILRVFGCMTKAVLVYSIRDGVYNLRCKLEVVEVYLKKLADLSTGPE